MGGDRRGRKKTPTASKKSCVMKRPNKACTRKFDTMSKRKYTIRRAEGLHLTDRQLEDWINTIHRESLNGETAYAYDSRLAKTA